MSGLGSANYTVAANATASTRTAVLTVAGQTVTITQIASQPPSPPTNLRIIIIR
jgi:hypothetical protein